MRPLGGNTGEIWGVSKGGVYKEHRIEISRSAVISGILVGLFCSIARTIIYFFLPFTDSLTLNALLLVFVK